MTALAQKQISGTEPNGWLGFAALHIIGFLVFGLLIGATGRSLVTRATPNGEGGWASSMLWGVCGALLGGFLGDAGGLYRDGDPAAFVLALLGAFALVGGYLGAAALRRAHFARLDGAPYPTPKT